MIRAAAVRAGLALPRLAIAAALVLSGCSTTPSPSPSPQQTEPPPSVAPTPTSLVLPSPSGSIEPSIGPVLYAIDGMPVASDHLPLPIAVMIDDNKVARPQSGFNAASVVYQAPADGGEDRYMFVFQEKVATDIGPVRSGRPYFVHWACEFRAGFAHYGGDLKTLTQVIPSVRGELMFDLDALGSAASAFHRIKTREKPHNAYTSSDDLRETATRLGVPELMVGTQSWSFRDDRPEALRPASGRISVPYNRGSSSYTYDRATNSYLRSVAGQAQVDPLDGKRVTARNVIVLFMRLSIDPESEPGYNRPLLKHIGTGKALVFRDGEAITGTWRKDSIGELTRFYDDAGVEIALVRGQVYIQVVPTGTAITYKMG